MSQQPQKYTSQKWHNYSQESCTSLFTSYGAVKERRTGISLDNAIAYTPVSQPPLPQSDGSVCGPVQVGQMGSYGFRTGKWQNGAIVKGVGVVGASAEDARILLTPKSKRRTKKLPQNAPEEDRQVGAENGQQNHLDRHEEEQQTNPEESTSNTNEGGQQQDMQTDAVEYERQTTPVNNTSGADGESQPQDSKKRIRKKRKRKNDNKLLPNLLPQPASVPADHMPAWANRTVSSRPTTDVVPEHSNNAAPSATPVFCNFLALAKHAFLYPQANLTPEIPLLLHRMSCAIRDGNTEEASRLDQQMAPWLAVVCLVE